MADPRFALPKSRITSAPVLNDVAEPTRLHGYLRRFWESVARDSTEIRSAINATPLLRPDSLRDPINGKTLTLSSTTTVATLTTSVATLLWTGMTLFAPASDNTIALGGAIPSRRWLSFRVGTGGINSTGGYTQSGTSGNTFTGLTTFSGVAQFTGGVNGDFSPSSDVAANNGDGTHRWIQVATASIILADAQGSEAQNYTLLTPVTGGASADRTITLDFGDADRTLKFRGNLDIPKGSAYTPTNVTTDRSYDADATSVAELADVLGTLIGDLQGAGIIT